MNQLICETCGAAYPFDDARWRCGCGAPLDIEKILKIAEVISRKGP